jgi:CelD/BcsL family acetyltransferase involved in cellulose biosynthesis
MITTNGRTVITTENVTFASTEATSVEEWHAETTHDDGALARIAGEWEHLYRRCSTATPFLSHAWLHSWWRSYGRRGALVLILIRRAGRLVAAAPLFRQRRGGVPVLAPLGAGISDFGDVLLDDSCAAEAAHRLVRELVKQSHGQVIDLREVPPTAAAWRLVQTWPGRSWLLPDTTCLELPAHPINEILQTLPRSSARSRRKKLRRIEAVGIEHHVTDSQGADAAVAAMLRLHREQWHGRGMTAEHGHARFAAHLARALPSMVERGQAALVGHRLDGDLVAVEILLIGREAVYAYLYGFQPDLRRRLDVTQLLLSHDLPFTRRLGRTTLSLLRGDEPHKRHWHPREARNRRILLAGATSVAARLYVAGLRGRNHLATAVKTQLPALARVIRWIKKCRPFST